MNTSSLRSRFADAVEHERERFERQLDPSTLLPGIAHPEEYAEQLRSQRNIVASGMHRNLAWRDLLLERVLTMLTEPDDEARARVLAELAQAAGQMFEAECDRAGRSLL